MVLQCLIGLDGGFSFWRDQDAEELICGRCLGHLSGRGLKLFSGYILEHVSGRGLESIKTLDCFDGWGLELISGWSLQLISGWGLEHVSRWNLEIIWQ